MLRPIRAGLLLLVIVAGVPAVRGAAPDVQADVPGATYYVRAGGNDRADGRTPGAAWRTIARVNQASLHPGDQVLFNGGETFTGLLYISPGSGGTAAAPVRFSSFGSGRAVLSGGAGGAFFAYDSAGISIDNLNFLGGGAGFNTADGIAFYNDIPAGVKLDYVRISNVVVAGFGKSGLALGGWNGTSGYVDVRVSSSAFKENRRNGLLVYGPPFNPGAPAYANQSIYVGHVSAYDNLGDPNNVTGNSGSGIVLGSVQGGTVEYSSAFGNGALCSANQCGAGIWAYDSTDVIIQHNESYSNHSRSRVDGDGFDLDQNVSSSYLQYNYAHNNDGAGFLDFSGASNSAHAFNTIRYNISENDARTNDGALTISGHVVHDAAYNNTVFVSPQTGASPAALVLIGSLSAVTVRNNILDPSGGLPAVRSAAMGTASVLLQQNDYSATPRVLWGSGIFLSLDSWRSSTGQERLGLATTGLAIDPALVNAGGGGTVGNPDELGTLGAYHLSPASPMIGAGLNLRTLFGTDPGPYDFYGGVLSAATPQNVGAGGS